MSAPRKAPYQVPSVSDNPFGVAFDIERRETIGRVNLSDTGTGSPVTAALQIIADYLNEDLTPTSGAEITFTIPNGGHTFIVKAIPNHSQNAQDALGNPWDK